MKILACMLIFLLLSGCEVVPLEPLEPQQPTVAEEPAAAPQQTEIELPAEEEPAEDVSGYKPVKLVNLGGIGVTAVDYNADTAWGPTLTLELQNETEHNLLFSADYAKSDGVMCNPYWNCTVAAGETVQSQMFWSAEKLWKSGISAMGDLVLEMEICHSEDTSVVLFSDDVSLSFKTGDTQAQTPPVWDSFPEQMLAEGTAFSVEAVGFLQEEQPVLTLRLNNETETKLLCTVTDVAVNGELCDPAWGAVVMTDAILYSELILEGAEPGDAVVMTLSVYNPDDRTADALFSGEVTVFLPEI